jgi:hypothetical protein
MLAFSKSWRGYDGKRLYKFRSLFLCWGWVKTWSHVHRFDLAISVRFDTKRNVTDIIVDFTIFHCYNAEWCLFFKAHFMLSRSMCVTIDGVWIGEWIYWLLIPRRFGTTSNYSTAANLHNSKITTAPAKFFPACCVFTSRSLATDSNSRDSSASRAQVLPSPTPLQKRLPLWNSTDSAYNISARTT